MPKFIDQDTGREFPLYPTPEWGADRSKFEQDVCKHLNQELRIATYKNGSKHYRHQCQSCGEFTGNPVPKSEVVGEIAQANVELKEIYRIRREEERARIDQKHIRIQRQDGNLFQQRHRSYLASLTWKQKRDKVWRRAGGVCEGCMEAAATQVHHLSYRHWGNELLFELVALCAACHERCHADEGDGDWPQELPCSACRWQDWDDAGQMRCGKFGCEALEALATDGQCGPLAEQLEPLK